MRSKGHHDSTLFGILKIICTTIISLKKLSICPHFTVPTHDFVSSGPENVCINKTLCWFNWHTFRRIEIMTLPSSLGWESFRKNPPQKQTVSHGWTFGIRSVSESKYWLNVSRNLLWWLYVNAFNFMICYRCMSNLKLSFFFIFLQVCRMKPSGTNTAVSKMRTVLGVDVFRWKVYPFDVIRPIFRRPPQRGKSCSKFTRFHAVKLPSWIEFNRKSGIFKRLFIHLDHQHIASTKILPWEV